MLKMKGVIDVHCVVQDVASTIPSEYVYQYMRLAYHQSYTASTVSWYECFIARWISLVWRAGIKMNAWTIGMEE